MKFTSIILISFSIKCFCKRDIIDNSINEDIDSYEYDENIDDEGRNDLHENVISDDDDYSDSLENNEKTVILGKISRELSEIDYKQTKPENNNKKTKKGKILNSKEETSDLWRDSLQDKMYSEKMRSEPQSDNIFHDKITNSYENTRTIPAIMAKIYNENDTILEEFRRFENNIQSNEKNTRKYMFKMPNDNRKPKERKILRRNDLLEISQHSKHTSPQSESFLKSIIGSKVLPSPDAVIIDTNVIQEQKPRKKTETEHEKENKKPEAENDSGFKKKLTDYFRRVFQKQSSPSNARKSNGNEEKQYKYKMPNDNRKPENRRNKMRRYLVSRRNLNKEEGMQSITDNILNSTVSEIIFADDEMQVLQRDQNLGTLLEQENEKTYLENNNARKMADAVEETDYPWKQNDKILDSSQKSRNSSAVDTQKDNPQENFRRYQIKNAIPQNLRMENEEVTKKYRFKKPNDNRKPKDRRKNMRKYQISRRNYKNREKTQSITESIVASTDYVTDDMQVSQQYQNRENENEKTYIQNNNNASKMNNAVEENYRRYQIKSSISKLKQNNESVAKKYMLKKPNDNRKPKDREDRLLRKRKAIQISRRHSKYMEMLDKLPNSYEVFKIEQTTEGSSLATTDADFDVYDDIPTVNCNSTGSFDTAQARSNSSTIEVSDREYQDNIADQENESNALESLDDYPYSASVQRKGAHYASGALIGKRWILSSAAEFYNVRETIRLYRARIGSVNCKKGGVITPLIKIAIHPNFKPNGPAYDISVLKTARILYPSLVVKPIGLSKVTGKVVNAKFLTSYWPRIVVKNKVVPPTAKERVKHHNMRVSTQKLVPNDECNVDLAAVNVTLNKNSLCLKPIKIHHSECMPDPGAPVVAIDGLWGITSGWVSPRCPGVLLPTIFTRVSTKSLRAWINAQMRL